MALKNLSPGWQHFIHSFPSDPECIRTLEDVEMIERVPIDKRFPCCSLFDALSTIARHQADDIALTFLATGSLTEKPQQWTYSDYHQAVIAAANLFYTLGVKADQAIALMLPNTPEMLFALWGAEVAGIALPLNPFLAVEQIVSIAREGNARILITLGSGEPGGEEFMRKAIAVREQLSELQHIVAVGRCTSEPENIVRWHKAIAKEPVRQLKFQRIVTGTETAAYFHTGGTTGTPKLAQHTHRAQIVNVCQMNLTGPSPASTNKMDPRSKILCGLPLFHVNAVFVSALTALMSGGELILAGTSGFRDKLLISNFWSLVERHRITFFAGVPTVYASLLQQLSDGCDISSLTHCSCGAAPMPANMLKEFRAHTGADIIEGYGMTETTVCAITHYYYGARRPGSIGMRIPYHQVRVVALDHQGRIQRDCDIDEVGVILHKGPNVILGYKQDRANVDAWPEPGWLNSGDMGRIDDEGYFWLTGRSKDIIIRGGHNIDPLITEDALTRHPDVELAAAVGIPDTYAGELPIAYVQLREGAIIESSALKAFARECVSERAAAPVEVIICGDLPKTAVGKIFKPPLRKDAIGRAYRRIAEEISVQNEISVKVEESSTDGLKVRLTLYATTDQKRIRELLAESFAKLTYAWEIELINRT